MTTAVRSRLLGQLEVTSPAGSVALGSPKQRTVLAGLLLEAGHVVSVDRLVTLLWGADPPPSARAAVHVYISKLRREFHHVPDVNIVTVGQGYLLDTDPRRVDVHLFRQLMAESQAMAEHAPAYELACRALALWRGPALVDVVTSAALDGVRLRLREEYLTALERRCWLDLELGRHQEIIGELSELTAEYPLREKLHLLWMVALHRSQRHAEALEVFRNLRRRLIDETGTEPGADLQRVHQEILASGADSAAPAERRPFGELPALEGPLVGRNTDLTRLDALLDWHGIGQPATVLLLRGLPGVGKTALATRFAHLRGDRFPDGRLFYNLSSMAAFSPGQVAYELLGDLLLRLGVPPTQLPATLIRRMDRYRDLSANRKLLLVLDDVDRFDQVQPLLGGAGAVLITSCNQLDDLVARTGALALDLLPLSPTAARRMLHHAVGADRVAAEPDAAAELARLCGYLPAALRMAAAKLLRQPARSVADLVAGARNGTPLGSYL